MESYQDAIPPDATRRHPEPPPHHDFPPPSGTPSGHRKAWFRLRKDRWCVSVRAIPGKDGERVAVQKKDGRVVIVQLGLSLGKEDGWYYYEFFEIHR